MSSVMVAPRWLLRWVAMRGAFVAVVVVASMGDDALADKVEGASVRGCPCDPAKHPCEVDRRGAIVLAADGSGKARRLSEALALLGPERRTIVVKAGRYEMRGSAAEMIKLAGSAARPYALVAADASQPPVFDWGVTTYPARPNDPRTGLVVAAPWWIIDGLVLQSAEYPLYLDAAHVTVRNCVIRRSAYDGVMVTRRHGGFIRIESNGFDEIGTAFPAELNTTPRHAIYYNADSRVTDAIIIDNDIAWCTGAALQMKAQEAYAAGKEGAGIYGLVFANNVVRNCKDGLNFYFWVFDGTFRDNSFVFSADDAARAERNIVHSPVWMQLRSSGGNRFERNFVYYTPPSVPLIVGYQTGAGDPANDSNVWKDNLVAVGQRKGSFGWNQRGAGMEAPRPFSEFELDRGGSFVASETLDFADERIASAAAIRELGLKVGAGPVEAGAQKEGDDRLP